MNTYEQKKAARIDRMRGAADKREAEASAAHASVRRIADNIPLGQPILVGHHSERKARRDIASMDAGMRKSVEATKEAEVLRRRADGAEASNAVSSDDPEAVEKLRAKLVEAERQQVATKEANARLRAGEHSSTVAPILDWWQDPVHRLAILWSIGHKSIPTTNLAAEIRRLKARIAELETKASAPAPEPEEINGIRIEESDNRVRLIFAGKPGDEVRKFFKSRGFRWSPTAGAWQRHASTQAWYAARECARHSTESDPTGGGGR